MRRRNVAKMLTVLLIATVASALFISHYALSTQRWFVNSLLSGVPAALAVTLIERVLFPRIYKLAFVPSVLLRAILLAIAVVIGYTMGLWVIAYGLWGWGPTNAKSLEFVHKTLLGPGLPTSAFVFVALLVYAAFAQVTKWMGPGVLGALITGRYHHPRREERIFMFLDMKDSTTLAEQLGDLKFSALVREFFYDMTPAIIDSDANILLFIGDEVVLTWPAKRGLSKNRYLRAFYGAKANIARRADRYRERYGVVPDFKAGVHAGYVVGTAVGDLKTELVYHGDVLNTSARIRSLCTYLNIDLLISEELMHMMPPGTQDDWINAGTHIVKGRQKPVTVFAPKNMVSGSKPLPQGP